MEMTRESLRQICKEHKLYLTPHLNDKLYCNFKGFGSVANLEEYCNLKALFLEGNAIESLQGLPSLPQLKCLYAQQNLLSELEGLGGCPVLHTLNVSANQLSSLQGLETLPTLHTLVATDNQLEAPEALSPLKHCTAIESLDLQNNKLGDADAVLRLLHALPQLKCLYLRGNPLVFTLPSYRKTVIAAIPTLAYLDDRPVFERERRCAEAWARAGLEEERAERERCIEEEQQKERRNFEALQRVREEGFRKKREALNLPEGTTDPFLDTVDDSEWVFQEEPEELRAARERLAAYTAAEAAAQRDEPLPALEEPGAAAAGSAAASLFDEPASDMDVRAVLEDRAANVAELAYDFVAAAASQPEENSCPNTGAVVAARLAGEAATVPAARVTVTVGDAGCSGANACPALWEDAEEADGLLGGQEEEDSGKAEGLGTLGLTQGPDDCGSPDAVSDSLDSDDEADLEALD